MSKPLPSKFNLLKQFLSNPIALIIYGLLNALFAAYLSSNVVLEAILIVSSTVLFFVVGYWWAATKQREAYMQSFPGQVRFSRLLVRFKVLNNLGDGELFYSFEGTNESDMPRRRLGFNVTFDGGEPIPDRLSVDGILDGRSVKWNATKTSARTVAGGMNEYSLNIAFDLEDLCGPKSKLPYHSFTVKAKGMYAKAFGQNFPWRHQTIVLTDELIFELETDPSVRISSVTERAFDFWNELDASELRRLRETSYAHKMSDHSARLVIHRPISSDYYFFYFNLEPAPP